MALVITLSLIVLVTIASMAFFVRAMSNRAVESSRSNRILASQVADTGVDYVAGQFLQEIAVQSTSATTNGVTIYLPTTNTFAVPQRPLPSALATDTNFANLLRRSVNESTNGIGETNATTHNSITASRNGRTIPANRWNAPQLVGGAGFTTSNNPNWIYVNRDGTVTNNPSANAIGRFSYNAYDVGGLLDINVAGCPSGVSGANLAILKGTLAGADLSVIPGITNPTAFVNWRNTVNASNATNYVTAVTSAATNGFRSPPAGENRVLTRQDLIKLARSGSAGINTNALPYLTAFNTALSAPASIPTTPNGSTTDYYAIRDNTASTNRFLPNVRVTGNFTRRDGMPAKTGEPLITAPFALSRLAGIGRTGAVSPATAATIQRDFGLVWQNNQWEYCGPSGSSTLASIATIGTIGNREPNFFELLKAGISSGSLGQTSTSNLAAAAIPRDTKKDYQIIQIGANLIDQYDADSYPVRIGFNSETISGVENLPYLNRVYFAAYRLPYDDKALSDGITTVARPWMQAWLLPVIWNPHADPYPGPTSKHPGPSNFRFVIQGAINVQFGAYVSSYTIFPTPSPGAGPNSGIKFPASNNQRFGEPTFLSEAMGATAELPNQFKTSTVAQTILAIRIVDKTWAPDWRLNHNADGTYKTDINGNILAPYWTEWAWPTVGNLVSPFVPTAAFQLQYQDDSGAWVPYSEMAQLAGYVFPGTLDNHGDPTPGNPFYDEAKNCFRTFWPRHFLYGSDPRTDRFGAYGSLSGFWDPRLVDFPTVAPTTFPTIRSDTGPGDLSNRWSFNQYAPAWTFIPGDEAHPGTLSDNLPNSVTRYTDPDGVLRRADGAYTTGSPSAGYPLLAGNTDSRPVVLNRPFRTVGEMGYVFRGMPWKHLDFFTQNSGDSALLDLFSANETPALAAGTVNPNTRQSLVLQAILKDVVVSELDGAPLSATDAKSIADALVARTTDSARGPLMNPGELVSKFAPEITFASSDNTIIKRRREAPIRALSAVSNTRTWNLMVDVIAQSGRFVGPSFSANDFIVEGEKRVWEHLALDRYTGRIIAQAQEPVNE